MPVQEKPEKPPRPANPPTGKSGNGASDLRQLMAAYTQNPQLLRTQEEYRVMRERMRKPLTCHALRLTLRDLDKFADTDAGKIAILEQSIQHSWQGVYEPKSRDRPAVPTVWQKCRQEQREMVEMILKARMQREAKNEETTSGIVVNG